MTVDTVEIARRVNGAVAGDLQAQRLRENYRRERLADPPECGCSRDVERLVATLAELYALLDETADIANLAMEHP